MRACVAIVHYEVMWRKRECIGFPLALAMTGVDIHKFNDMCKDFDEILDDSAIRVRESTLDYTMKLVVFTAVFFMIWCIVTPLAVACGSRDITEFINFTVGCVLVVTWIIMFVLYAVSLSEMWNSGRREVHRLMSSNINHSDYFATKGMSLNVSTRRDLNDIVLEFSPLKYCEDEEIEVILE